MDLPARILDRIDRAGGPDACWLWTGARLARRDSGLGGQDYGVVWIDGKVKKVHRVVFEAVNGPLTQERPIVLHVCDNPPCCNPAHLKAGTYADNAQDMVTKARHARGAVSIQARSAATQEKESVIE